MLRSIAIVERVAKIPADASHKGWCGDGKFGVLGDRSWVIAAVPGIAPECWKANLTELTLRHVEIAG
jgi:hypothetical protein